MRRHPPLWFHVDMDAFYAAVEQRDNPAYRGKPVIIGAMPGTRGVVSTCSYEARGYGVHSAMPVSQAYRLCPEGIYIPPRMDHYVEVSGQIMEILRDFSPEFIQVSIDEAFINMTGTTGIFGPPEEAAALIKERVRSSSGLTISVGGAGNRLVAKMASGYRKPDGLTIIPPGEEASFVQSLDIRDLWGVGKKTQQKMEELNIQSVSQLAGLPVETLKSFFGKAGGEYIYQIVRGMDPGIYDGQVKSHSLSNEHTFSRDCKDRKALEDVLFHLAHGLVFRLRNEAAASQTLVLKLRLGDFSTSTVQKKHHHRIQSVEDCYSIALELLGQRWDGRSPVRLIGLGFSGVEKQEGYVQSELFETGEERRNKVEEAVLKLQKRYGELDIGKARKLVRKKDKDQED